jgi:molecular chaperone GrpE
MNQDSTTDPQDDQNANTIQDDTTLSEESDQSPIPQELSELEQAQDDLQKMTLTAQRAFADYQNLKRQMDEQRESLQIFANKKLLAAIFPALDNMQRAFDNLPDEIAQHEWVKGIEVTEKGLLSALESLGLESISEAGIQADPHKHEILMQAPGPEGQILQIFEKGYSFKGQTVRPAKVQVGSGE